MIDVRSNRIISSNYDDLLTLAESSEKISVRKIKRLSPFIKNAYSEYDKIISRYHLEPNQSRFKKQKKVIEGYFSPNPPTEIAKELYKMRRRKLRQCPFCGRPGKPRILDHFIPKSDWPEFSLLRNNLVNQCNECSSKKWRHYYCEINQVAKFIHPYYSHLLTHVNFNFDFDTTNCSDIVGASIDLKILISRNVRGRSRQRIIRHLKELDVKGYALEYAKDKYDDILDDVSLEVIDMVSKLEDDIKLSYEKSHNHWDGCIFEAMLKNTDIMAFLVQHQP
jgi:5-methylcytosine-specific restriction endonuclease McrA